MIEVLAKRYGWTKHYIAEELYWEEMFQQVQIAANFNEEERNAEYKFHFMLHADKDAANKWKDFPLPFPAKGAGKEKKLRDALKDSTGVKQLHTMAPHIRVSHLPQKIKSKKP